MRNRSALVMKLFATMFIIYALLRLSFMLIYFPDDSWPFLQMLKLFYWGFRMDFSGLFYINLPFLLYWFFIDPFIRFQWKDKIAVVLFSAINLPFLAINFLDLVYYKYNHRRSTVDLLDVFADSSSAFSSFLQQYWYVLLIFLLISLSVVTRVIKIIKKNTGRKSSLVAYLVTSLLFIVTSVFIARGFSKRPILPSTPLLYFQPAYQPLVNNSTFNFLYSIIRKQTLLEEKNYFTSSQLDSLCNIHHQYQHDAPFQKKNVVFFVLESFSKEFFKGGEQEAKMPFFDSLMQHSTVFNNAYANALESNKGLPAILASLPDVMDEPVYLSNYSNINFKGIGHILKEEGYNTSFFMGAEYDHFGFAKLCKMAGIDEYYSSDTYGKHKKQHDGTWGIYDEYFFSYFAETLAKKQQPFFTTLFNISSHSPYKIPEATAQSINVPGQLPHQNSITYVDYCYKLLFQQISKQPWFNNTIFVFVADHGFRYTRKSNELLREIRIPLFIYDPQQPVHTEVDKIARQLDIIPSVLDKLNYTKPFTSFGSSVFRDEPAFSINRLNETYQYIDSTDFIGYDDLNNKVVFHYRYRQDSLLSNNLSLTQNDRIGEKVNRVKAVIQRVNNSLVNNKFLAD
jgi:phosphoglycerol transferase MdoB-like AlkP superfamily enzyme